MMPGLMTLEMTTDGRQRRKYTGDTEKDGAQITAERKDASTLGLDWVTIA